MATEEPETLDSPDSTLEPGVLLDGKFRIEHLLGAGGMGAVYAIKHEITQHQRALKLLHPQYAQRKSVVERFLREASAAGHIGNEHIIETFDAGWLSSGEPYLVMELLDGKPLDERVDESHGGMSWSETVEIFLQLCDGVQAAHDAGIVHRDLKPENVFLARGGGSWNVKILDFGVSKFDEKLATKLTTGGSFVGTPAYMSPEQFENGADVDSRSDVYSLGIILYEMLAGDHPYPASTMAQLARMILTSELQPLLEIRADLPPAIDDLLAKVVTTSPDARIATARGLAAALRELDRSAAASVDLLQTADVLTREAPTVPRSLTSTDALTREVPTVPRSPVAGLTNTDVLPDPAPGEDDVTVLNETLQSAEAAAESAVAVPRTVSNERTLAIAVGAVVVAGVVVVLSMGGDEPSRTPSAPSQAAAVASTSSVTDPRSTPSSGVSSAPSTTATFSAPHPATAPPSMTPSPKTAPPGSSGQKPLPKRGTDDEWGG